MARIAKRLEYERELIQIVQSKRPDFYGQRGTHSQGIDVLFFKPSGIDGFAHCIRAEVKTSNSHKIMFPSKVREQYARYMDIWDERRIITFYFYRLLTSKTFYKYKINRNETEVKIFREGKKEDKWRVFRIDELPQTRKETPYLGFFHENAMVIDEFLKLFPD
jgi:hypothetical protein